MLLPLMIFLLILPLSIVIVEEHKDRKSKQENIHREDYQMLLANKPNIATESAYLDKSFQAPNTEQTVQERVSCWDNILNPPQRGEDYTILQAIFSLDMEVLLLACICSLGSNLTMVNN